MKALPALKEGTVEAAIWMDSPVLGFLPVLASRFFALKVPNPTKATSLSPFSAFVTTLIIASTWAVASDLLLPAASETALINSALFL